MARTHAVVVRGRVEVFLIVEIPRVRFWRILERGVSSSGLVWQNRATMGRIIPSKGDPV